MNIYEVLVASPYDVQWLHLSGRLDIPALGARPVEGGFEAPAGEPLYVAQAYLAGAWRPGKHSAQLGGNRRKTISVTVHAFHVRLMHMFLCAVGAFIPYDGKEIMVEVNVWLAPAHEMNHSLFASLSMTFRNLGSCATYERPSFLQIRLDLQLDSHKSAFLASGDAVTSHVHQRMGGVEADTDRSGGSDILRSPSRAVASV